MKLNFFITFHVNFRCFFLLLPLQVRGLERRPGSTTCDQPQTKRWSEQTSIIFLLSSFIIVTVRSCNAFAKAGTRNPRACFLACKEVAVAASNEIVHCILWKRRCVLLCVCVFVCDALMLCVCAVLMDASQ